MTADMQTALAALRANREACTDTHADGTQWAAVLIDNAKPATWSRHKFAGVLSALEKVGLYRPECGEFEDECGNVRLA